MAACGTRLSKGCGLTRRPARFAGSAPPERGPRRADWGMPVQRLNHAVLYVRDVGRSGAFYRDVLGFETRHEIPGKALFLVAPGSRNDHDLGLFAVGDQASPSEAGTRSVGLYHLAWEVETLEELGRLRSVLAAAGALVGASDHGTSKSLYARDPDGIEFEVGWMVPRELWGDVPLQTAPLDLDAAVAEYGADTPSYSLTR